MMGVQAGTVMEGTVREGRTRFMGTRGVVTFDIVPGMKIKKNDSSEPLRKSFILSSLKIWGSVE